MDTSVSVLLNVWEGDDDRLLELSLSSIYAQTQTPSQLVVVVDGPIPIQLRKTLESILARATCQVLIEHLPQNLGLSEARNIGISLCENRLIALHDADDLMHPERLRNQSEVFAILQPSVLGAVAYEFDVKSKQIVGQRKTVVNRPLTTSDMWILNPIHHSTVMMSKDAVTAVGMYSRCPGAEDLNLWRRLARDGAVIVNTNHVLQALGTDRRLLQRRRINAKMLRGEVRLAVDQLSSGEWSETCVAPASFVARCAYRTLPLPLMSIAQNRFSLVHEIRYGLTLDSYLNNPVPIGLPTSSAN